MRIALVAVLVAVSALALLAAPAQARVTVPRTSSARVLRPGMRGPDVLALQVLLTRNGYPVSGSGWYGPLTRRAVVGFQHSRGLHPDAIVGPATLAALAHAAPKPPSGSSRHGSGWVFPLRPVSLVASPRFWTPDQGVDIPMTGQACGASTREVAVTDGTIVRVGVPGFGSAAPVLRVEAGPYAGRYVYYGHAQPAFVYVGQHVARGQGIAEVGCGRVGRSDGPHLEIGISAPGGPSCCPGVGQTSALMLSLVTRLFAVAGGH